MKETSSNTVRGTFSDLCRTVGRFGLTVLVAGGAAMLVYLGAGELERRANASAHEVSAPATPVTARPLRYQTDFVVQRGFVGQIEAQRLVHASFELSGQLAAIAVDEGDDIREGDVLATLDTALLDAERARLKASQAATAAQLEFAEKSVTRNMSLSHSGFASEARLDESLARRDELRARAAELTASVRSVDIQLEKSVLRAPFDGRITARLVDGGESLGPGQPVVQLVETGAPQFRVGLPLDRIGDDLQNAEIDIGGTRYSARLLTLRPDVDPVTRTRFALFALEDQTDVAFGQTARLVLEQRIRERGFWLPVTALKEGVRGQWTVLTVDDAMIVRAAPVEVMHAETDRVYVRSAIPAGTLLIKAGPQRVTTGQTVTLAPNS
ncbi:MAG: efflux RND transporter periplasmic adaptor subunit [Pseudomonadota bacterium]